MQHHHNRVGRTERHRKRRQLRKRRMKRMAALCGLLAAVICGIFIGIYHYPLFEAQQSGQAEFQVASPPASPSAAAAPAVQEEGTPNDESAALPPEQGPIHIIFAGDALMDWSVKKTIRQKGPDYPFQYVAADVQKADFAVVNLETAITRHTEKDTNQWYNFKSDPVSLKGLKNAGFDLVSIANNHTLDFKQKGFLDTLHYLKEYDLPYVGGGMNKEEAYRAHTVTLKGKTVKFLAFSRFIPQTYWFAGKDRPGIAEAYNKSSVLPVIERERKDCDYLFIYMHWGVEKNNRPEKWQRDYAREMIDAGADAIIGSHVHVLQGFEFYKDKPIAYSIGNFLFPDYVRNDRADTGLLTLMIDEDGISMSFDPYFIYKDQIVKKDENYEKKQLKYLESISFGVKMNGKQAWDAVKAGQKNPSPSNRKS
ncbi:CapA family protein [Paenibacillus apiarius]|uniref:CapA family protein n=1 Tax=Paenibacillus apiarius TaxID=46240 RepID=A0ABT4DRT5_9BACL|nr:CapA family protein [Paenibacillus apiarius]MCY9514756.1 CapA family protein [Paenibacillus apiarius]MCY9518746.1 CapA family protein [Paenibacillus apiarius]MCY9552813.1 CapA family protein [Paenibacillus apiarius]MCY9556838.1 CapA family protein [Paenibacillus apiarius]MCY9686209.1 CapA family protein [Paenibacillus apiarius]